MLTTWSGNLRCDESALRSVSTDMACAFSKQRFGAGLCWRLGRRLSSCNKHEFQAKQKAELDRHPSESESFFRKTILLGHQLQPLPQRRKSPSARDGAAAWTAKRANLALTA